MPDPEEVPRVSENPDRIIVDTAVDGDIMTATIHTHTENMGRPSGERFPGFLHQQERKAHSGSLSLEQECL